MCHGTLGGAGAISNLTTVCESALLNLPEQRLTIELHHSSEECGKRKIKEKSWIGTSRSEGTKAMAMPERSIRG